MSFLAAGGSHPLDGVDAGPPGDDDAAPATGAPDLLRPFIVTRGRTRSSRSDIRVETMIEATGDGPGGGVPEEVSILEVVASGPTSVAEIGAHTGLPLGVVTVLVGDLLDTGAVRLHQTDPVDIEVSALTRMIERVRAL